VDLERGTLPLDCEAVIVPASARDGTRNDRASVVSTAKGTERFSIHASFQDTMIVL
jgi:hypothetical protein